jgi:hypothetical protein
MTPEGALIESVAPLPVGSVQPIRLIHGSRVTDLRAAVRHLRPVAAEGGGHRYLVGVEFLGVDEEAAVSIGSLMEAHRERFVEDEV